LIKYITDVSSELEECVDKCGMINEHVKQQSLGQLLPDNRLCHVNLEGQKSSKYSQKHLYTTVVQQTSIQMYSVHCFVFIIKHVYTTVVQ